MQLNAFLKPLNTSPDNQRVSLWTNHRPQAQQAVSFSTRETFLSGFSEAWLFLSRLNRLEAAVVRCKTNIVKLWNGDIDDTICICGEDQTRQHFLACPHTPDQSAQKDLEALTPCAIEYIQHWIWTI